MLEVVCLDPGCVARLEASGETSPALCDQLLPAPPDRSPDRSPDGSHQPPPKQPQGQTQGRRRVTLHLARTLLAEELGLRGSGEAGGEAGGEVGGGSLRAFASYNTPGFNAIVRYKFAAIRHFLGQKEAVLFTDGDVVFLQV